MSLEDKIIALAETIGTDVRELINGKVDKGLDSGLSDTNFTQAEKDKLDGIALEATKNRDDSENADKLHTHEFSEVAGLDTALADKASKAELNAELALKADRVEGKVFSDTNFTQAEKDKLASLENYSDTKPFTDDDKTKLNGIAAEATKNRADSENADKEHTHELSDVNGLDTALESKASKTELTDGLSLKVDKVVGKDLSDTNYTQAEKDKLASLESSRFKGQYISLVALQAAFPVASVGDYANVDEGVGQDVVRYVWDTSDSVWIQQLGISTQLTAAEIKQEYESNPDTNVFSDVEKLKLSEIEAGAQVNVDTDLAYTASSRKLSSSTGAGVTLPQVTTTLDGLMLSVDKNKLDTVEANAKDDQEADEVPVTPVGSLVATNVQTALEDLHTTIETLTEVVEKNTAVTGTSTLVRYDKLLGNLDVVQMDYTGGDLTSVRYSGDNNTDSFYRDVLVYSSGNLTSIKHYYDKPDLVTGSAETVLVYDVDSNLISTQYTEL